jgi:periplasmic divalent cation tolerance protein
MKPYKDLYLVLVTAPDLKTARKLAQAALQDHLAACVNIIPRFESHYWWQGKLEKGNEVLLLIKTTKAKLAALEKTILANHPYDTPEFLATPLSQGNERYCAWLQDSVKS